MYLTFKFFIYFFQITSINVLSIFALALTLNLSISTTQAATIFHRLG